MEALLSVLCGLGFALLMIALVGHGLWVATAAIFRGLSGTPDPANARIRYCPSCRAVIPEGRSRCPSCGWSAEIAPQPPLKSLEALVSQVDRLHKLGSLDALAYERLNDALQTELERVRTQARQDETAKREAAAAQREAIEPASIFETDSEPAAKPEIATAAAGGLAPAASARPSAPPGRGA